MGPGRKAGRIIPDRFNSEIPACLEHDTAGWTYATVPRSRPSWLWLTRPRFKIAMEARLAELLARDQSGFDLEAMMVDGISFAESAWSSLAIRGGTEVPVDLWDGDSENHRWANPGGGVLRGVLRAAE